MFAYSELLSQFDSDLSYLTTAQHMFESVDNLYTIKLNLPKLQNGYAMFNGCKKLVFADINAPELTDAGHMFAGC